jgi:hypothetical protein
MTGVGANNVISPRQVAKQILEEHLKVGPEKPVSYLPVRTIENVIGMSVDAYVALIDDTGNQSAVLPPGRCCINSGAVYAYSPDDLDHILQQNNGLLSEHGWPVERIAFIKKLATEWVDGPVLDLPVHDDAGELHLSHRRDQRQRDRLSEPFDADGEL